MPLHKLAMVSFFALAASSSMVNAASSVKLLAHRATYDLQLLEADERSGVDAMSGKMVYEFTGGACQGYRTNFRFVSTIEGSGNSQVTDQRSMTFEDPDGQTLVFSSSSYTDNKLDTELEGVAEQKDGKVFVVIDKPTGKDVSLGEAIFPVKQTTDIIAKAIRGEVMNEVRLFDASDDADAIVVASTFIGKPAKTNASDEELKLIGKSAGKRAWPVTTTFHKTPLQNDSLPEYQMSFVLHENGISRDLTMRYSNFSLKGTMTSFEVLPQETCQ